MLLKLYGHYKNGILPFDGGLLKQPNFYIDAMELIDLRIAKNAGNKRNAHRSNSK